MSAGTRTPTINTVAVTTTDFRLMFDGPACSYTVRQKTKRKNATFNYSDFRPSPDKTAIEPVSIVNRPTVTGTEPWPSCISPDPMSSAWQRTKCSEKKKIKNNVARILATFADAQPSWPVGDSPVLCCTGRRTKRMPYTRRWPATTHWSPPCTVFC